MCKERKRERKKDSQTRKERKRERKKDSQTRKHRERERDRERDRAVEPTIMSIRSPSSSPPRDGKCSIHPSTTKIAHQHPSTSEIDPHPRAPIHMTHPCPISLFLDLSLPFPHLSITLSYSFSPFD